MNFCIAILILKMEENMQHFRHITLYYFKKGRNTIEIQKKKICAVYGEGAVTDGTWLKMVDTVSCWRVFAGWYASQLGKSVEVDSDQIKKSIESNRCSLMWEIADILKISKLTKLLIKMKNVSFILWKKPHHFLADPLPFGSVVLVSPLAAPTAGTVQFSRWLKTMLSPWNWKDDHIVQSLPTTLSPATGSEGLLPVGSAQVTQLDINSPSHGQVGSEVDFVVLPRCSLRWLE